MLKNENKRIQASDGQCAQLRTIAFQLYARLLRVLRVYVDRGSYVCILDFVLQICHACPLGELRELVMKIDSLVLSVLRAAPRRPSWNADND